jgi:hypothetical protein
MWCLRCYEPIRQLTPRDPGARTITFLRDPNEGAERSRWRAGVNTFGPVGRIVTTLLVIAFAPWTTNAVALIVMWPIYLVGAAIVLRATWKKDDVVHASIAEMAVAGRPASPPQDQRATSPRPSGALRPRPRG